MGFSVFCLSIVSGQQKINGLITAEGKPLPNVHISNRSSGLKTSSDNGGHYLILANPREELQFTHMGMDTVSILVEDITQTLNIRMTTKINILDEVIITERISRQKKLAMNYFIDSSIVNSSFGYLSPATVAYHLKVIDGSEFSPGSDILYAIASRLSGIRVDTYTNPTTRLSVRTLFLRGGASIGYSRPALFEVDGNIFTDPPDWLDVTLIKRVGIIPGLQAVWRYGHIAGGGVVIINTKNSIHGLREENSYEIYDQAKLRNNFLKDKVLSKMEKDQELPTYLISLKSSSSMEEAIKVYDQYSKLFSSVPYFYIDSYNIFYQKYGHEKADEIINVNFEYFKNNPVWLKALAFSYESQKRFKKAYDLYKKIYVLRPDYAQSYIDLASSYTDLDRNESATSIYARYAHLLDIGLMPKDSLELSDIVQRELNSLTFLLDTNRTTNTKKKDVEDIQFNTRLVFEWNDSEAEFELQFVNPNNQYFNWKHTMEEMPDRIRAEKKLGYSMVDFLMDDALPGDWKVNATYFGNKQLTPTYLKATIYRNYGSRLQTKEVNVFRLDTKETSQNLYNFILTSEVVHH